MTHEEYRESIQQLADISKLLTPRLNEYEQDLFEAYCTLYEQVVIHETVEKLRQKKIVLYK